MQIKYRGNPMPEPCEWWPLLNRIEGRWVDYMFFMTRHGQEYRPLSDFMAEELVQCEGDLDFMYRWDNTEGD